MGSLDRMVFPHNMGIAHDNPEQSRKSAQVEQGAETIAKRLAERSRQVAEQASWFGAVLDSITDGVIVLDSSDKVVLLNPAAKKILDDMSGDFSNGPLLELPEIFFRPAESSAESNARQPARRFRIGGRVLSTTSAPVHLPGGDTLGTVIVIRDVTREAEAESLKDNFISSVSHELRTPLTAIKGYSELLIRLYGSESDSHALRFARAINHNTTQLMQHINGLIDMTQIQSGDLQLHKQYVAFDEIVNEVVQRWRTRIESKGLTLQLNQSADSLLVHGDRDRLFWAVHNLLSNAYNYTLDGGLIRVRVFGTDSHAQLDVQDTGVGIATSDQPYLFSRFFRARNEQTFTVPGVGLGLFITRSIIEQHDGRVWAESELGSGSTFSLAIPLLPSGPR
jgi:signal transduction histidine kinase